MVTVVQASRLQYSLVVRASSLPVLPFSAKAVQAGSLHHERGFTLLELIVATSIALFVFGVGYLAISSTVRASNESTARIREAESARLFFNLLERDLATGFPGPGNIVKKRLPPGPNFLQAGGSYVHNAATDPSPMLITEANNSTYPSSDIIQFYCRSQDPLTRDECMFVRYYINKSDHTVCRRPVIFDPNAQPPQELPDYEDPRNFTTATNSDLALFENARTLAITFQQWDPVLKKFVKEAILPNTSNCDSILVTLIFTDQYKQSRMDAYHADNTRANYQANAYHTYSKVFALPASFKQ